MTRVASKKLSVNINTRNELSNLKLYCLNTCTHTKLILNCHTKDTLTNTANERIKNIFMCNSHYVNFKYNDHDLCKEVMFNTGCYQANHSTHMSTRSSNPSGLLGPVPDWEGMCHTCVCPVVVFHSRGCEEWVVTCRPGALKRLFSRVEFHVVVQGPLLGEASIT